MTDLDSPKKNNDCYFYYYSTCVKGDNCTFRHEPSALGCETVCSFWKEGKCVNVHCNFRHMELKKNRKAIPCYWESQPIGCLKAHCPFLHQNSRQGDNVNNIPSDQNVNEANERKVTAVDSLVVNFEEESDNESMPTLSPKKVERTVTVKSLEEIRLEKIQAESAAYYSFDDFPQYTDINQANLIRERICSRLQQQEEPQRRVFNTNKRLNDGQFSTYPDKRRKLTFQNTNGQLEIRLNKNTSKSNAFSSQCRSALENPRRFIPDSASSTSTTNIDTIKIKTLEEIRAERKARELNSQNKDEQEVTSTSIDDVTDSVVKPNTDSGVKKKIVLRRRTHVEKEATDSVEPTDMEVCSKGVVKVATKGDSWETNVDEGALLDVEDDVDEDLMLKPEEELLNEIDND